MGNVEVKALDGVDIHIEKGEFVGIMGPSGSGKSTLLNQIGCLDRPTDGDVLINGRSIREMSDNELTDLRRDTIGYIFQTFNLTHVRAVVPFSFTNNSPFLNLGASLKTEFYNELGIRILISFIISFDS
jgi:ABC-type lipoprotein export system ATPase subunit